MAADWAVGWAAGSAAAEAAWAVVAEALAAAAAGTAAAAVGWAEARESMQRRGLCPESPGISGSRELLPLSAHGSKPGVPPGQRRSPGSFGSVIGSRMMLAT